MRMGLPRTISNSTESRACPACNSPEFKRIGRLSALEYAKCKSCGLSYSLRVPSKKQLDSHYNSYPRTGEVSVLNFDTYGSWVKLLCLNQDTRLLDYGCGSGEWITYCQTRAIDSSGIEQNNEIITSLVSRGLKVFEEDYLIKEGRKFTALTSIEVIEHLTDVKLAFKTFTQLLEKNAYLLITTPNYNSLNRIVWGIRWRAFSWPDHLQLFSKKTLVTLLRQNGFQVLKAETTGHILLDFWGTDISSSGKFEIERQRRFFQKNTFTRFFKRLFNFILRILRLGDTLTVVAKLN